jgi:hypothetical protein
MLALEVCQVSAIFPARVLTVLDIIGPNSTFVSQSGTFPQKFMDFKKEDTDEMTSKDDEIMKEALTNDYGVEPTPHAMAMARFLGR